MQYKHVICVSVISAMSAYLPLSSSQGEDFTLEMNAKDQMLFDIMNDEVIKDADMHFEVDVINGLYPIAYEDAYRQAVEAPSKDPENYSRAIHNSAEYLAAELRAIKPSILPAQKPSDIASWMIGINYKTSSCPLTNCIHDLEHIVDLLFKRHYTNKNIDMIYMTDDQEGTEMYPTLANIRKQMKRFVAAANATKKAYIHYSGHGTSVKDTNRDEKDGKDEALVPVDFDDSGFLVDDEIFSNLVMQLQPGVNLIATIDCCHSGTILDLPFKWDMKGKYTVEKNIPKDILAKLPRIVMISGCKDSQTSADGATMPSSKTGAGAMTAAYVETLIKYNYKLTYKQLIEGMNSFLKSQGFTQKPELTTTMMININDPFEIDFEYIKKS